MTRREQLTLQWVQSNLGGVTVSIESSIADASTRSYLRVSAGERSLIVMDAPGEEAMLENFLRAGKTLRGAGVHVPEVHAVDRQLGLMLLEDLGDRTYLKAVAVEDPSPLYTDAIETLVRYQTFAEHDSLPPFDRAFLMREMSLFAEWFLTTHLDIVLSPTMEHTLNDALERLCASAIDQPRVFMHRDYHSRNLMALEQRNPGVLDHQDAVSGPLSYDLASLLRDVYVRWTDQQIGRWTDHYWQVARDAGLLEDVSREQLERWSDWMALQRHLKIAGLFVRLHRQAGKSRYLADLPLTLDYIVETCAKYAQLQPLGSMLADLGVRQKLAAVSSGGERR